MVSLNDSVQPGGHALTLVNAMTNNARRKSDFFIKTS